eukprot:5879480-Amphidinium_carterae.1
MHSIKFPACQHNLIKSASAQSGTKTKLLAQTVSTYKAVTAVQCDTFDWMRTKRTITKAGRLL